jgi:hypothetical protein
MAPALTLTLLMSKPKSLVTGKLWVKTANLNSQTMTGQIASAIDFLAGHFTLGQFEYTHFGYKISLELGK